MPLLITRDELYQRLITRLRLSGGIATLPQLADIVLPVMDIVPVLRSLAYKEVTKSITGIATFDLHTVPLDERWKLIQWEIFKSTGTWTYTDLRIVTGSNEITFDTAASRTSSVLKITQDLILETGWILRVNVDAQTVTGNMVSKLLVAQEAA